MLNIPPNSFSTKKLTRFDGVSFFVAKLFVALVIFSLVLPINLQAAMQSANYVIYENVMHTFDGPVISNISATVSGQSATVEWETSVISDAFVVFDTDNGFLNTKEQGTSVKAGTSHSVEVTGLEANTLYYYRVKSTRVNGGTSVDTTERSFTTGDDTPVTPDPVDPGGGGGILIIDKTDKVPPVISGVSVTALTLSTTQITWTTDEPATSFVEFGTDTNYGSTYGSWASTTDHSVTLENLISSQTYHFRALSSDNSGNVSYSEDRLFATEEGEIEEPVDEPGVEDEPGEEDDPGLVENATQLALQFINRLFPEVSLNNLGTDGLDSITSLEDLSGFVPAPILSGEPRVEIRATEATIVWTTDVESNSQIAIAPDDRYSPEQDEPYLQVVGNSEERTTTHEVTVYGLIPDTTYHYQLRSKGDIGPTATSRDFVFRTSIEELSITSFISQIIDNETAVFRWVTNKESDSTIQFSPYYNNVLAIDQAKTIKDNAFSVIHEIEVKDFVAGTFYDVEIISVDDKGNVATEVFSKFSTSEDDFPPEVSQIKADSTVFVDRGNKIQTIISWLTNEPSTSQVYFQEGVHGGDAELSESTTVNTNYTKEHVMVITKFKPGIVYSFRVESIDSGGNASKSKPHTFMTAKKKESIIQIIMKILEDTFGWAKKLV